MAIKLSKQNIFVSKKLAAKAKQPNAHIISCGVDLNQFRPMSKQSARAQLQLNSHRKYVLFSSSFDNKVKNYPLAKAAIEQVKIRGIDVELLEYKGYTRKQAATLFNAVDAVLVTSHKESGPLVIKEAMAVNTPTVSVDVGDVAEVTDGAYGSIICDRDSTALAQALIQVFRYSRAEVDGRSYIRHLHLPLVAKKVLSVYNIVVYTPETDNAI